MWISGGGGRRELLCPFRLRNMLTSSRLLDCDAQRPELNLRLLLLSLVLVVLVSLMSPVIDGKSHVLVCIYAMTFLFGCCKTRRSVLIVLPALYLPFAWWSLDEATWRFHGLERFWYTPGLCLLSWVLNEPLNAEIGQGLREGLGVLLTLTMFLLAVLMGRASGVTAAVVGTNAFCLAWLLSGLSPVS